MSGNNTNLQKVVSTATAVVGGIALLTKLGIDEMNHRNMKAKTNPANAYSSIRILPDLVRFQGFIRVHRRWGSIKCPVPFKIEEEKKQNENNSNNDKDQNDGNPSSATVEEQEQDQNHNHSDKQLQNEGVEGQNESITGSNQIPNVQVQWLNMNESSAEVVASNKTPKARASGWFDSISNLASSASKSVRNLHAKMEQQTEEFESTFPLILRDSAIHQTELEEYILEKNKFLDLFEPISFVRPAQSAQNEDVIPLHEQWEFCPVKIHHETLYIRYAKKWITLSLKDITIAPLTLKASDCTSFIVDYQKYFTILEEKGMVLLCQHLDDPFIQSLLSPKPGAVVPSNVGSIEVPDEHSECPLPFVQQYLVGYHNTSYVSLRKEQVLRAIVDKVSNGMKDQGFDNRGCYDHVLQFRRCLDEIVSEIKGADRALEFKKKRDRISKEADDIDVESDEIPNPFGDDDDDDDEHFDNFDDDDQDVNMQCIDEMEMVSNFDRNRNHNRLRNECKEEKFDGHNHESLPYLNLLNDQYHGLQIEQLSVLEWKLSSEASWLANYVYDFREPRNAAESKHKKGNSWSQQFQAYVSSANLNASMNMNGNDGNEMDLDIDDAHCPTFRGPAHLSTDPLWRKHSNAHYNTLSQYGFELLDYAVTMKGQSVQWMICRSYDYPNTIFLTFKGTSNPLDAMVNIGLHPLELPRFQCSIFSGMYASLQQSLPQICSKLKRYSSDQYFQSHPCPPKKGNHGDHDDDDQRANTTKIYKLVIAGHSLGGGYAQLFLGHLLSAAEFENYFETVKCITFAAPLVYCHDVRNSFLYEKLTARCLNFVYQFDLVPRMQNKMAMAYRNKLLRGLLLSQLPVSNIGMVFDINQRLNFVMTKFQEHQWLLDRYCSIGKYVVLFEMEKPRRIDKKHLFCFTKSAKSNHLCVGDADTILKMTERLKAAEPVHAVEVLEDHKMLNYMKTIMFQQF